MGLLKVNPYIIIRPSRTSKGLVELTFGQGDERFSYFFDNLKLTELLLSITEPQSREVILKKISEKLSLDIDKSNVFLNYLIEEKFLVDNSVVTSDSEKLWEESGWRDAFDFEFSTTDLTFSTDRNLYREEMSKRASENNPEDSTEFPGPYKEYIGEKTFNLLDAKELLSKRSLHEVMAATVRYHGYGPGRLSFEEFSELTKHTYGVTSESEVQSLGIQIKKTSPSGGARHPVECYVYIHDVENLERGIYHYHPKRNQVVLIHSGDLRDQITGVCFEKDGVATAPAVFILTLRWFRHMWKYRYARSYKMTLYDTGHLIQTHLLNSNALGLQSFPCPSFHDEKMTELLGIHSELEESPLYVIGTGKRNIENEK